MTNICIVDDETWTDEDDALYFDEHEKAYAEQLAWQDHNDYLDMLDNCNEQVFTGFAFLLDEFSVIAERLKAHSFSH